MFGGEEAREGNFVAELKLDACVADSIVVAELLLATFVDSVAASVIPAMTEAALLAAAVDSGTTVLTTEVDSAGAAVLASEVDSSGAKLLAAEDSVAVLAAAVDSAAAVLAEVDSTGAAVLAAPVDSDGAAVFTSEVDSDA